MSAPVTDDGPDTPQSQDGCPDEATCHHRCIIGCWRVVNAEPLSSAGMPRGQWPPSVRRAYGTVVQAGASTISGAFDAAVAAMDSSPAVPATSGPERDPDTLGELADPAPPAGEDPDPKPDPVPTPLPEPDPVVVVPNPPTITPPETPEVRMHGPEGQGIPIIDLDAQLANLDQTVVALRAWARVMHAYADQAAQWADGLAHLRDTLNGDT